MAGLIFGSLVGSVGGEASVRVLAVADSGCKKGRDPCQHNDSRASTMVNRKGAGTSESLYEEAHFLGAANSETHWEVQGCWEAFAGLAPATVANKKKPSAHATSQNPSQKKHLAKCLLSSQLTGTLRGSK